jgi:hypothetical protein
MKLAMFSHVQFSIFKPSGGVDGRLSVVQYTPRMGTSSSLAHLISQASSAESGRDHSLSGEFFCGGNAIA